GCGTAPTQPRLPPHQRTYRHPTRRSWRRSYRSAGPKTPRSVSFSPPMKRRFAMALDPTTAASYDEGHRTHGSLALDRPPLVWGPAGAPPDERRLRHLVQVLAEVLAGRRPAKTVADRL